MGVICRTGTSMIGHDTPHGRRFRYCHPQLGLDRLTLRGRLNTGGYTEDELTTALNMCSVSRRRAIWVDTKRY